jgi:acyl-coenzyme A thioesterase PaaI-like protein
VSEQPAPAEEAEWLDASPGALARRRTAYAARELLERLCDADAPAELFDDVSDQLEAIADRWRSIPTRVSGRIGSAYGWRSLMLPDLSFDRSDPTRLVMNTRIGIGFEGPPGRVHGGVVSYLFDNLLGQATMHCGTGFTMTGTLSVRYAAATPIDTDLRLTSWVDHFEGRKSWVCAELEANGAITATCEAIMIVPRQGMFGPPLSPA